MQTIQPLLHDHYYHIYNCGINGESLFREPGNYEHFLRLYEKYIETVAETYAWCLMGNHFHLLVRIKEKEVIGYYLPFNANRSVDTDRLQTTTDLSAFKEPDSVKLKAPDPTKHFSHLFNAYAKYFNIRFNRHGSLFERPFKRKLIDNETYLKRVVVYIHNNPVHHGFCDHPVEYPWSSYLTCISTKPSKIRRTTVLKWFTAKDQFEMEHNEDTNLKEMETYLEL